MSHLASSLRHFLLIFAASFAFLALDGCVNRHGAPRAEYASAPRYTVEPGDTLTGLSERFHVPVSTIVRANHLRHRELIPGRELIIPGGEDSTVVQPPIETVTTIQPPAIVDANWYIPRSAWAVQPIDSANIDPMTRIYRMTVHHSSEHGDATGDPEDMLRLFEKNHKGKGWACIGYHFIIAADGRVFEGRPLKFQGAHASGDNNIGNIGVCLLGDFEHNEVPATQRAKLIEVLDRLRQRYGIDRSEVHGHREFKTTDCPGRYLMAVVDSYRGGSGDLPAADPGMSPHRDVPVSHSKNHKSSTH